MDVSANATKFAELDSLFTELLFIEDESLEHVGGGTITNTL